MQNVLHQQHILHLESLSAGVWYIAIDFQLFLLMSVLLWLGRRWPAASLSLVALGMAASMFGFNRDDTLDDWAIYFFGSYGLGAMAYWLGKSRSRSSRWELAGVGALVAVALSLHFRGRLVLACGVAASLYFSGAWGSRPPGIVAYLSRISYALFLIHYPIVLLANRVCVQCEIQRPAAIALCALATWLASLLAAALFHHWIESPCIRSVSRSEKI